ncbi:MAG: gluconolactonase [Labilithrix sp.]|nr:gluconolactonase [Labilithrix sp.]
MNSRKWPVLVILASAAGAVVAIACSETGPDAGPRGNGCIGQDCFDASGGNPDGGGPLPGTDGGDTDGAVEITDPLAGINPLTAKLVKGGYQFTEGPVWIGNRLIFSDTNASTMYQLYSDGGIDVFRNNSGRANGNAVDAQGRLVTCEGSPNRRRVTRTDAQLQTPQPIATTFNGSGFNEPNDVIVRKKDGTIYFTDPRYSNDPDGGQDKLAAYRLPPGANPDQAQRLAFDFNQPNGIALSPDEGTLYVVNNGDGRVLAAPLNADGTLGAAGFSKIADADGGDGMAVDDRGNLYVAATAGILVFDKAGAPLGTITIPQGAPSNCAFGGSDRKTLFITSNLNGGNAATGLYSIKLNVPGLP